MRRNRVISDILSDAIANIKTYQKDLNHSYESDKDRIDFTIKVMDNLRAFYDTPPGMEVSYPFPEVEKMISVVLGNGKDV